MDDLSNSIASGVGAVVTAPWPFFAVVCIVVFGVWKVISTLYSTRIQNAESTITMLEKRIGQAEAEQARLGAEQASAGKARSPAPEQAGAAVAPLSVPVPQTEPNLPKSWPNEELYVPSNFTPERAMKYFVGRTALQGEADAAKYVNHRIKLQRAVKQVNATPSSFLVVLETADGNGIYCFFGRPNLAVETLSIGDVVQIDGLIERIYILGIDLQDCRLIRD